jgi:hypothetical protein
MPRPRSWTDEDLAAAVAASSTLSEVHVRLGLRPGKYALMRAHIARLGLDASHIPGAHADPGRRRRRWDEQALADAVRASTSLSGACRLLGYTPNGGVHRMISGHVRRLGIDTSHFTGQAWAKGVKNEPARYRYQLEAILVEKSPYYNSGHLRRRLIAAGIKPDHCEECGGTEWRGRPLPLHLDHINGDHTDNRLENLRILCPNCHAITDTWCRRKVQPAYSNWQRDGA